MGGATDLALAPYRAIVALDFDGTLTVRDVAPWHLHNAVDVAFGGAERVAALTKWLQALAGDGALLAIVSRNARQIVQEGVTKVGWGDLFGPRVYGREDVEWHSMVRTRKSVLIRKLLIEPFGLRGEDVIIVDDDEKACVETEKHIGATSVHVKGRRGLVDDDLQAVRTWMDGRVASARSGHRAEQGTALIPDGVLLGAPHRQDAFASPPSLRRQYTQPVSAPRTFPVPWRRGERPPGSSASAT